MPNKLKYQPKPGHMTPGFSIGQTVTPKDAEHEASLLRTGNFVTVDEPKPEVVAEPRTAKPTKPQLTKPRKQPQPDAETKEVEE